MKKTSGSSALSPLCARAARALALNREARLNFPGIFMGISGRFVGDDRITLEMEDDPAFRDAQGEINWLALGVLVDVALGASMRTKSGPTVRPATVQLQMQMTGAPTHGDLATHARYDSFTKGTAIRQCLTSATVEAGGRLIAQASGVFAMFDLPAGSTQAMEPWLPQALAKAPLADVVLDEEERAAVTLCRRAERAATATHPFIDHFWSGIPTRGAGRARLTTKVTPHLGNRIGHVHGGVLLGLAACVASAALPGRMRLSNISAWFTSPGQGPRLKVRSTVVQQGRNLALVRTQILSATGKLVLDATSQHAAAAD